MRAIVLTVLMMALPAGLAAQEDAGFARIRRVFPPAAAERIEAIVQDSRASGVPADALLSKALEGAAKGVPADRVIAVLSEYATRLGEARGLVGSGRGADEVVAAADALRRGVPPDAVQAVAEARAGDAAVPLIVLGDLMEAGVPVEQARQVVSEALQRGGADEQLLAIPGAVRRMIRDGRGPGEAASAVRRGFQSGQLPPGIPAAPRGAGPGGGPPVPPGTGPPGGKGKGKGKGPPKGKGKPPGGGPPDGL